MTTRLRVVVDQMISPIQSVQARYTRELTRNLILTAPKNCLVEGIVSALPPHAISEIELALPGLANLHKTSLPRRELMAAWQLGIAPGFSGGLIHAPGLMAPLVKHDRDYDSTQIVVTVHDTLAWTHPKTLTPAKVAWNKGMLKRARKHADAIVTPSHAVAARLSEIVDLGDRVRVIGGAASISLDIPTDADRRAAKLKLPEKFILTVGTLEPRNGVTSLIAAMGLPGAPDLPLLVVGPDSWGDITLAEVADEAGLAPDRVRALGRPSDSDFSVILDRASLFVHPGVHEGFGQPIVEAFRFGLPVVLSDDPALVELAGGAGVVVEHGGKGYPERLAAAMNSILDDSDLASQLSTQARDREKAFSWRDSAERVWQLHADL